MSLALAAASVPLGDRGSRRDRRLTPFLSVNFSDTRVVHGILGTIAAPRSTRPLALSMHRSASGRLPIPPLLQSGVRRPARASALRAAIPMAPVATIAEEEPATAVPAELLQQRLLVIVAPTAHVRPADARRWTTTPRRGRSRSNDQVASATDRRARVSRPGPSPSLVRVRQLPSLRGPRESSAGGTPTPNFTVKTTRILVAVYRQGEDD